MHTEFGGVALYKWPLMNEIATITQSPHSEMDLNFAWFAGWEYPKVH